MSLSYFRVAKVVLEQYTYTNKKKVFSPNQIEVSNFETNAQGLFTLKEGLRVVFKVTKTTEPQPNLSTIEIYNLHETNRAYIEAKQTQLTLYAGYLSNIQLVFTGDVAEVVTRREGPDIITSLSCGDGEFFYGKKHSNFSFGPKTSFGTVLDKVISDFGFTQSQVKGVNRDQQYNNGFSFIGMVKDVMGILTLKQGLEWSIQNNALQILPETQTTDESIVVLTPETGLVGTPFKRKVLRQDQAKKQNGLVAENGIICQALLDARLNPGRQFQVQSEFVNGNFKVYRSEHTGDTYGQQWFSSVEGLYTSQQGFTK